MNIIVFYILNYIVNFIDGGLVCISKRLINKGHKNNFIILLGEYILPIINACVFTACLVLKCIHSNNILITYNIYVVLLRISFIISCMIFLSSVIKMFISHITLKWRWAIFISFILLVISYFVLWFINNVVGLLTLTKYIQSQNKGITLVVLGYSMIQITVNYLKSNNDDFVSTKFYKAIKNTEKSVNFVDKEYLKLIKTNKKDSKISSLFMTINLYFVIYPFLLIILGNRFWMNVFTPQAFDDHILIIFLCAIGLFMTIYITIKKIMHWVYYRKDKK